MRFTAAKNAINACSARAAVHRADQLRAAHNGISCALKVLALLTRWNEALELECSDGLSCAILGWDWSADPQE